MNFALAVTLAAAWWSPQGVHSQCAPIHPVVVTDEQMQAMTGDTSFMAADGLNCRIYLSPAAQWSRTRDPQHYGMGVTHEYGHLGGLAHTHNGSVMDEDGQGAYPSWVKKWPSLTVIVAREGRKSGAHVH